MEKGEGSREKGVGRREKGEGRREKDVGIKDKGLGLRIGRSGSWGERSMFGDLFCEYAARAYSARHAKEEDEARLEFGGLYREVRDDCRARDARE
jgi:hypothetical protein